jgi:hypothetical protein
VKSDLAILHQAVREKNNTGSFAKWKEALTQKIAYKSKNNTTKKL